MTWNRVLVGVDGSEGSRKALRYAADEAAEHDASLTVLLAYTVPAPPVAIGTAQPPPRSEQDWRENAENLLQQTVQTTIDDPDLKIVTEVVEGPPARALIHASHDADLLVVGTRGHGGFAGMLLGSVSQHLAAHAACTVAVVR